MTHLEKFTGGRSEVSNFGVSGMSTRRKFQDMFNEMKHYRPDVVFMNLSGNDITESTDIQNVVKRLKNIVKELYENGTTKVFVATVIERGSFPKWSGPFQDHQIIPKKTIYCRTIFRPLKHVNSALNLHLNPS